MNRSFEPTSFGQRLALGVLALLFVLFYRQAAREKPKRLGAILGLDVPPRPRPVQTPLYPNAALLRCTFCQRETIHFREELTFVCINRDEHAQTFPYRSLASSFSDAAEFPGCICCCGEFSLCGEPDPRCLGLAHRP